MAYLDDIEQKFRQLYWDAPEKDHVDHLIKFIRGKLLESYKNGAQAERNRRRQPNQNKDNRAAK